MIFTIHPSAADNFDKKAFSLLDLVEEFSPTPPRQESFPSDLHIPTTITDKEIIGDIELSLSDYQGNSVARFFFFNGKKYGLVEDSFARLIDIAEGLQSLPQLHSMLSCSFIEKTLFSWISDKYKGIDRSDSFIEFLDEEAQGVVKKITTWIPIANLDVQVPFPVSKSEIRRLSKEFIDGFESMASYLPDDNKDGFTKLVESLRKDFQGFAAVVTVIESEPEYAFNYAMEEASKIISIIGIFSVGTLIPDLKCASNIKGSGNASKATVFFENQEGGIAVASELIDAKQSMFWRLSQSEITRIREGGLEKISKLLASDSLSKFQESVLNSIFLYSKSAFTSDPVEKVVYILSSMESILLKNESEPIQQNLSERVAVFTSQKLDERKLIIKTIREAYGIRSKYLHHGRSSSELRLITDFMRYSWLFFKQLLANTEKFKTKDDFVNAVDDHKLA